MKLLLSCVLIEEKSPPEFTELLKNKDLNHLECIVMLIKSLSIDSRLTNPFFLILLSLLQPNIQIKKILSKSPKIIMLKLFIQVTDFYQKTLILLKKQKKLASLMQGPLLRLFLSSEIKLILNNQLNNMESLLLKDLKELLILQKMLKLLQTKFLTL